MNMSNSSCNIRENIYINKTLNTPEQNNLNKQDKKRISLPMAQIKDEIYIKLNEGTILNFIRNSIKKETPDLNSNENSSEMKYDLKMINKYEEESNSNLSFISEFDLEEEENKNNESFDSCFDENSVEEIDIVNK